MLLFIFLFPLFKAVLSSYCVPSYGAYQNISVLISNSSDICRFMEIKNNTLYRVGESNLIQNWYIPNISQTYQNMQYMKVYGYQTI